MLIRSHRQEALSRAYVHTIAARCGLLCSFRDFDYGIDMTIHSVGRRNGHYRELGFNLDVQLKSTTTATRTDTHILHDLEVMAYDDLRQTDAICPRILILLVMPADETRWTEQNESHLLIRDCAYWLSLAGLSPTQNTSTIQITVPRANVFSAEALTLMMERIRKGEPL